jgi:hypothetical protein
MVPVSIRTFIANIITFTGVRAKNMRLEIGQFRSSLSPIPSTCEDDVMTQRRNGVTVGRSECERQKSVV